MLLEFHFWNCAVLIVFVIFRSRWCGHSPFIWKLLRYFHSLFCYSGQGILTTWLANMSSSWGKIYIWRLLKMHKNKKCFFPRNNAHDCSTKVLYEQYLIGIAYTVNRQHGWISYSAFWYSIYHARISLILLGLNLSSLLYTLFLKQIHLVMMQCLPRALYP
jgi:hypothetical protein